MLPVIKKGMLNQRVEQRAQKKTDLRILEHYSQGLRHTQGYPIFTPLNLKIVMTPNVSLLGNVLSQSQAFK